MRSMIERTNPSASLALSLGQARRRWRLRHLAAGAVIVVAALGITVWGAAAVMERLRFNAESVVLGRIILGLVAAVVGVRWILYPLLRRITDDRLALYLEEKVPSLDGAVLSAVEVQRMPVQSEARSPLLERGLLTDAVRRMERATEIPVLERPATLKSAAVATLLMAGVVAFIAFGPQYVRQGTRLMLTPWSDPAASPVYAISLEPGDVTVARGSDVQVNARLQGFTSELVEIVVRRGKDGDWQRIPMGPSADSGAMTARLFDVAEDAEYFVEASNVRSPVGRLTVRDLPAIDSVAVELRFPGYTGLAPERVTNGGDIAALTGTRATVQVRVSRAVRAGSIVFDNGSRIALTVTNGMELSTAMVIRKDGFYRIELEAEDGTKVPGPIEYVIDALDDAPPGVSITKPGRDMRPSAVDEVLIEAEATDDYGVGRMELVYRVNGGAEKTIPLTEGAGRRAREMSAAHTIFLEEMGLQPGDVVAYFARAWDNSAAKQQAASDIYFLTVRPFDRTFRQNQQGGGGGGGGGGENNPGAIVEQQREIISATYKAQRDSARTNARTLREDVATIHLSQGKLREQVAQMITRLQRPGVQQADSGFRKILEYMKQAQDEMQAAEQELAKPELGSALGPEQRALQQAERAEAVFRDVQVSMQQGGQGGGGGGNANASDLADMLELETDKMRNQYEGVQRSQQEQAEQKVDETLERLKRLAARQQQENEKLRQRAQQMQGGAGGGGGSQRQLAEETEQLARQLERLAREQQNQEMGETARRLQDAANQMRRSASSNGSAGSGAGGAAAEQLEQARRLLEEAQRNTATGGAAEAAQRAERLAAQQREVGREVESLEAGAAGQERARRLDERKAQMANEAAALERDLERMARDNRAQQTGTARAMREAADGMRRTRVEDRIKYSRQTMTAASREFANNVERQIQTDLDSLAGRTSRIAGAAVAGSDSAQRVSRTLAQARDLVRGLSSLEERMRERQQQAAGSASQQGEQGQQGQQGGSQQGQGQQGRGQQTQGQQGQGQQGQGQQGQGQQGQGQQGQGQQGQGQGQGQQGQGQQGQGQGQGQGQQGQGGGGGGQGGQRAEGQGGGQGERRGLREDAGGEPGGQRQPGGQAGGNGQGGPGRFSAEDVRQFTRELRAQRESAEALRRNLAGTGVAAGDLDRLIARLREMEAARTFNDPEELERLQGAVLEGVKEFEFGLRRQLGAVDKNGPVLGGSDDVPAAYRDMVNEYFRSLSRRPRRD